MCKVWVYNIVNHKKGAAQKSGTDTKNRQIEKR